MAVFRQSTMYKKLLLPLAILLLALASCNKPDGGKVNPTPSPDPGPTPVPDPPSPTYYFKAEIQDLYVQGPDDTGFTIAVDTNMGSDEWTVSADADWITTTKNSKDVVIVPALIERDQNNYPAPRSCRVSVKAGTVYEKTFTVVQEAWTRINSSYEVKLNPGGETLELNVLHNCYSWTPATDADWLTVRKKDTATLVVTSSPRGASDSQIRSAVVRLQSDWQADTYWEIKVSDAESELGNEDYDYGDRTDWD